MSSYTLRSKKFAISVFWSKKSINIATKLRKYVIFDKRQLPKANHPQEKKANNFIANHSHSRGFWNCVWTNRAVRSFWENRILLFSNGVDFHSTLHFQEVLSQYLWKERSILKVEEKTIIFQFWVQMGILDIFSRWFWGAFLSFFFTIISVFITLRQKLKKQTQIVFHFWVEMGPFQIQNVHFWPFFGRPFKRYRNKTS